MLAKLLILNDKYIVTIITYIFKYYLYIDIYLYIYLYNIIYSAYSEQGHQGAHRQPQQDHLRVHRRPGGIIYIYV